MDEIEKKESQDKSIPSFNTLPKVDYPDLIWANVTYDENVKIDIDKLFRRINTNNSSNLQSILDIQEKLKKSMATEITFSVPILKQGDNPVFFRRSINVVQGQSGAHKSRLSQYVCSAFIKKPRCANQLIGFQKTNTEEEYTVVYLDTERNLSDGLPYALQSILLDAGYDKAEVPDNFKFTSLLLLDRNKRFAVLNEFLNYIKQSTSNPLFIVLDVSTDFIEDFNTVDKSMQLIDLLNMTINEYDVTFLCIIHENPGSSKARGHFGTELMNKASTVLQVAFEKDGSQNDTDLIRVKYLKCRNTERHQPFYMKYSKETNGLILAESSDISNVVNSRKQKASIEDVIESIEMCLGDGTEMSRRDLIDKLCHEFDTKERTIEDRLKYIMESDNEIFNEKSELCKLVKESREKMIFYKLIPVTAN